MAEPLKRMTKPTRLVLAVLMEHPTHDYYGLDLADRTGLKSGSLYTILGRLEDRGWLTSHWEDTDPVEQGRPRRRYYQLTAGGMDLAREAIATAPAGLGQWLGGGATA